MTKFKKEFTMQSGATVTVEAEQVVKVVSDNDDFYLFEDFTLKQYGTLGNNFHAYAWDPYKADFVRCPDPKNWGFNPSAKFGDLKFSDVDYASIWRPAPYAKAVWQNGTEKIFYDQQEVEYFLNPSSKYAPAHQHLVDAGEIWIEML